MCGIAGYVGDRESADVLVDALSKLEYRGLHSSSFLLPLTSAHSLEK